MLIPPLEGEGRLRSNRGGVAFAPPALPFYPTFQEEGCRDAAQMTEVSMQKRRGRLITKDHLPHPGSPLRSAPPPQGEGWEKISPHRIKHVRHLRQTMTRYEVKLWLRLRALKARGFHFRRQVPIAHFIVDFACHTTKLLIEVDGMQHGFDAQLAKEQSRDKSLTLIGFKVLRFINEEIWQSMNGVVEQIFLAGQGREPKS